MKPTVFLLLVAGSCFSLMSQPGALDPSFAPTPNWSGSDRPFVRAIAVDQNGRILVAGLRPVTSSVRSFVIRLNPDGSRDTNFAEVVTTPSDATVYGIATSTDGKLLIGGTFDSINGLPRGGVARLHPDGDLDLLFNPCAIAGSGFAFQADGKIIVGGTGIARLHPDGSRDATYNPPQNDFTHALALQPDGKCIAGKTFGAIRLSPTGSVDTSFSGASDPNGYVRSIALQPDGKVLLGGGFERVHGVERRFLARLNPDGTLDTGFAPSVTQPVREVALYPNGKITIAGFFTQVNGVSRSGVAQLNPDGSLDTSFDPGSGANELPVMAMALQLDGKVVVGGSFTNFNGVPCQGIARLLAGPTNGPPGIVSSPANQTVVVGEKAVLLVSASGTEPLGYQWQHGGANIPGATNQSLIIEPATPEDAGEYRAIVSNPLGAITSETAVLGLVPCRIIFHPESRVIQAGSNVSFTVEALGPEPLVYQWTFNGASLEGANTASLAITNVQLVHQGAYGVEVRNSFGAVTSHAAQLTVLVAPVAIQPPLTQTAVEGGSITLSVAVFGNPGPFWYLWRREAARLSETTLDEPASFLTIANLQTNQSGLYSVAVTNAAGTLFASCTLTVLADTDRDGMPDTWESERGYNPTNSADGLLDSDGDGLRNWQEYVAGTDPTNALSYLRIDRISVNGPATIEFAAVSNRTYTIEYTDTLERGAWTTLVDLVARPENRTERIIDPAAPPQRYYRLVSPAAR
jgi:uncharacterized delta-60 repeat protein